MEVHLRPVQQICIAAYTNSQQSEGPCEAPSLTPCLINRWLEALREATAGLPEGVRITTWKGSLFDKEPYVDNYRDFRQKRGASVAPLEVPLSLPALPDGIAPGELPTAEQLLQDLAQADCAALHPEV